MGPLSEAEPLIEGSRSTEADPQAERPAKQRATVPALATPQTVPSSFAPTPPETSPPQKAPSSSTSMMPMEREIEMPDEHGWQPLADKPKTHSAEVMQSKGDAATRTKEVQKLECL